jgi:homocysteine S-methyltransferase
MVHPLLERLDQGALLADGAMGTMLYEAGRSLDECLEAVNLSQPEIVAGIHRAYINAGAELIETNTFGANRFRLESHGMADKVQQINSRGVRIAREEREISGRSVIVSGSVGPTGRTIAPFGTLAIEDVEAAYREQIEVLLEAGVDMLTIETMGNIAEMEAAIRAARAVSDLPIIALMTFAEDGRTLTGSRPEDIVDHLVGLKVDVIGANCSVGPQKLLNVIERMRTRLQTIEGDTPWIACMPNAGWPTIISSRVVYRSTPEYFADFAIQAIDAGANIVGGCCGTTPAHIAAMNLALAERGAASAPSTPQETTTAVATRPAISFIDTEPTELLKKIGKRFIRCVEIDPPKGLNPEKALKGAKMLKEIGVDAINVAESPMARVRMSAMTLCMLIQQQVGIETIIHFTTRDRSLMGLQSELLGAHAAGVRNILALTGDPPSLGNYAGSSAVYDVDSIGLIRIISQMNRGSDSSGAAIGNDAGFTIACAVDPTKPDLQDEARRLREKIAAGANFVMTQPIFDVPVWTNFLEIYGVDRLPLPVMIGILPLQSSKHAEFLHNEVPGITLTDGARDRMRLAGADGRREGVKMAQELLYSLKEYAEGVYLMPSFGRYEVAAEVIEILKDDD